LCLGGVDNFDQGFPISPPTEITVTTNPERALHLTSTFLSRRPESTLAKRGSVVLPCLALRVCCYKIRRGNDRTWFTRLEYRNDITIATELLVELKMVDHKIVKIKIQAQ
jgi:hypothetical protein